MTTALGSGIDIFLQPEEWYFGDRDTRIRTTLGSCVAVTLWQPELKLGGMCHYMLPGMDQHVGELNGRYGNDALQLMVAEIGRLKGHPGDYEAKLFGGASMFDVGPGGSSVSLQNVRAAEQLMQRYNFNVVARSLGGSGYRQLLFDIATGDVWMRQGQSRFTTQPGQTSGGVA